MPARSIRRAATVAGYAIPTAAPFYVDSDDNALKLIPAGTGTTELAVCLAATASGFRFAGGSGALVTGALVVATGLTSIIAFTATLSGTGASATGATEVDTLVVASITTGAVTVNGAYHSGTAAVQVQSVSGTATFYWIAVGT